MLKIGELLDWHIVCNQCRKILERSAGFLELPSNVHEQAAKYELTRTLVWLLMVMFCASRSRTRP